MKDSTEKSGEVYFHRRSSLFDDTWIVVRRKVVGEFDKDPRKQKRRGFFFRGVNREKDGSEYFCRKSSLFDKTWIVVKREVIGMYDSQSFARAVANAANALDLESSLTLDMSDKKFMLEVLKELGGDADALGAPC